MSDKPELLPCPFCGREAKLDVEEARSDSAWCFIRCSYRCKAAPHVGDSACIWYWSEGKKYRHQSDEKAIQQAKDRAIAAWNTRAPAEDVRAVVEEPVAWRCGGITWSYRVDAINHAERFSLEVEPLYRHPQRPVVLPERIIGQQHGDKIAEAEQRGWNACLDAVEELNK